MVEVGPPANDLRGRKPRSPSLCTFGCERLTAAACYARHPYVPVQLHDGQYKPATCGVRTERRARRRQCGAAHLAARAAAHARRARRTRSDAGLRARGRRPALVHPCPGSPVRSAQSPGSPRARRAAWHLLLVGAIVLLAWNPYTLLDAVFGLVCGGGRDLSSCVRALSAFSRNAPWARGSDCEVTVCLATAPIAWLQFHSLQVLTVGKRARRARRGAASRSGARRGGAVAPFSGGAAATLAWLNGWCAASWSRGPPRPSAASDRADQVNAGPFLCSQGALFGTYVPPIRCFPTETSLEAPADAARARPTRPLCGAAESAPRLAEVATTELKPVYLITGGISRSPPHTSSVFCATGIGGGGRRAPVPANDAGGDDAVAACSSMGLLGGGRRLVIVEMKLEGRRTRRRSPRTSAAPHPRPCSRWSPRS